MDIAYPSSLHKEHRNFPLIHVNKTITHEQLTQRQRKLLKRSNPQQFKNQSFTGKRLFSTLESPERYTVHIRHLQFLLQKGLKLTKVYIHFTEKKYSDDRTSTESSETRNLEAHKRDDLKNP